VTSETVAWTLPVSLTDPTVTATEIGSSP
jgi:hypothetical protein